MKTLRLVVNRIKRYATVNLTVFILFVIGSIITSTFFAYFYGNTQFMKRANDASLTNRKYTVELDEQIFIDSEILAKLKASDSFEIVSVSSVDHYEKYGAVEAVLKGDITVGTTSGRGYFRDGEEYSAVVDWIKGYSLGDEIKVGGESLKVIGRAGMNTFISERAFTGANLSISKIDVYTVEKYRPGTDGEILSCIRSIFDDPTLEITAPQKTDTSQVIFEIVLLCITFSLSVISLMLLINYLIDSIINETAVCLIVGASKIKVFLINFLEIMTLSFITSGIGIALHGVLYNPLFSKINAIEGTEYFLTDYLCIFLIYNVLVAIVSLTFIYKYVRMSPAEARRRAG